MTNEQLAIYLRQIESRVAAAYQTMFDTLHTDEKYVTEVKGLMGKVKDLPILQPLADIQNDLENSIELLQKVDR